MYSCDVFVSIIIIDKAWNRRMDILRRIALFAAMTGLLLTLVFEEQIYYSPVRMHVIANSQSAEDQSVKLKVRDAILELSGDIFGGAATGQEALNAAREHADEFEAAANEVLKENGFSYTCRAVVGRFKFPDKEYSGIVYPAGEYDAVRLILGEGGGENWWCVMYPPLCVTGRAHTGKKVIVKSAFLEWIRSFSL